MPRADADRVSLLVDAISLSTEAAEALAPETELIARADVSGVGDALRHVAVGCVRNPGSTLQAIRRFSLGMASAGVAATARATGRSIDPVLATDAKDRRFADPAWTGNGAFFGLQQAYLLWVRLMDDLVAAATLDGTVAAKAQFVVRAIADALAPTNTLPGNPAALRRAFDTGGISVVRGARNMLDDLRHNGGMPKQVDSSGFVVGQNLATTPGQVVFRNDLMELIQYEAQTSTTFDMPLLLSPPWINKYYIMDLASGRSFAEWAVTHGHTTFAISYRNPDASMRNVALDDYLLHGPLAALEVIGDITGGPKVNIVGLCLGGTLTTMLLAYLAKQGAGRIGCATLLNTLVDFSEPGVLGVFLEPWTVARLEKSMAKKGYLEARQMAGTFDLLRANDLIWNYVANNWLMGEKPPAFDLLAWNGDSTRMPATMHSFYLRSCYQQNQLARGEMVLADTPLRLEDIGEEVYVLAAKEDHIAPWKSQYDTTQRLRRTRFVLSSSGHIAGIVNPPGPKAAHWTNDDLPPAPDEWLAGAIPHQASWWEDWAEWIGQRAGAHRKPPKTGNKAHPPLGDAPGTYVHAK